MLASGSSTKTNFQKRYSIAKKWLRERTPEMNEKIDAAENIRIENALKYDVQESYNTHPLAIYTSRILPNEGWSVYSFNLSSIIF